MQNLKSHRLNFRVYYEDTDAGGIVYHANYLRFFERGRTEWLREAGINHQELLAQYGLIFAVRACQIDYLAPARLDDMISVETAIHHMGGSRLDMSQRLYLHAPEQGEGVEKLITQAIVTVVGISKEGRALRIPEALRSIIQPHIVALEEKE